jgi:hypothetical protein
MNDRVAYLYLLHHVLAISSLRLGSSHATGLFWIIFCFGMAYAMSLTAQLAALDGFIFTEVCT